MAAPRLHPELRDTPLSELVAEPVLVGWTGEETGQYQHLGRLSEALLKNRGHLTLWAGLAETPEPQLLVNFHLPVTTRPAQPKTRKDMYLVIPAEHLHLDVSLLSPADVSDATRSQLGDNIQSDPSRNLVHVRLALGQNAYAVMPNLARKLERPLAGAPSRLLSSLKALTEVKEFDLYLYSGHAEEQLKFLSARLQRGGFKTPDLDLHSTYPGGRGGTNIWDSYPCRRIDTGKLVWNPLVEDAPPPYHAVVRESPPPKAPVFLKDFSPAAEPYCPSDVSSSGTRITWRISPQPLHEQIRATDISPQLPPAQAGAQKRKAADAVSDNEGPAESRVRTTSGRDRQQTPIYDGTTDPDSPSAETPEQEEPSPQPPQAPSLAVTSSAALHDLIQPGCTTDADSSPPPILPLPPPVDHEGIRLSAAVARFLQHRKPAALPDFSHLSTPHLFFELREFLALAWQYDIAAHDTHLSSLLLLGACAREGNTALFDVTMRECQRRLLRASKAKVMRGEELVGEVEGLLDWLNRRVCRNAGALMMPALVELKGRAEEVEGLGGAEREKGEEVWRGRLAGMCAAAFWGFGGLV
ncbi:hypothetical protein GTA08_BOTSDO08737 [Botryosphaeria dothidea]|uniref:Uncharacterized protein n=1 Tax=Botryosphaeria dothidea TaxID=55169 RepID=A0A8H4MXU8_9PEZI|nr:hypothetical protein GTA08_BOTSDO08737 [Botryosphaeria dothidea]